MRQLSDLCPASIEPMGRNLERSNDIERMLQRCWLAGDPGHPIWFSALTMLEAGRTADRIYWETRRLGAPAEEISIEVKDQLIFVAAVRPGQTGQPPPGGGSAGRGTAAY
jgi:hypothetical protein